MCFFFTLSVSCSEGDGVSLRLLQLAFSERKCLSSGKILYEVWTFLSVSLNVRSSGFDLSPLSVITRVWSTVRNATVSCWDTQGSHSGPPRQTPAYSTARPLRNTDPTLTEMTA